MKKLTAISLLLISTLLVNPATTVANEQFYSAQAASAQLSMTAPAQLSADLQILISQELRALTKQNLQQSVQAYFEKSDEKSLAMSIALAKACNEQFSCL
ncbi:hypothetical protein [Alkalimonas mucilaginosa]|uniref:Uncharacterized protein n=1 Tax=Alkalimonas mucilaginosa TaxID=3057676 RepID=A0ABU7JFF7_9GAMM|nr:hypothetical protein [Alkalimonas sp. MEB004]MEE2024417.1 hypothetical protein [Alkalimonas sp. MEB004]